MLFTPPLRALTTRLACVLALCAMVPIARAASEAPAAASPVKTPATGTKTYKPKAGETLDQAIANTMGASPLSMGILRQAYIDQNPQGIIAGKVPKLRKGATLNLPDHDLLLRGVLASVTPVAAQSETSPRPAPSTPEDRKRWVQFP